MSSIEPTVSTDASTQAPVGQTSIEETGHVDRQFDALCEQYYRSWFRFHPEEAVDVGVYDFAHLLRSYDHDDYGALITLNQKMQSALVELNEGELDHARQIDYRLIRGAISIELHDLEENDWRFRDPLQYVPVHAIYQLLIHPGKNMQQAFRQRLEMIPDYLRGAKTLISDYPQRIVPQWASTAIETAASGASFIRDLEKHPLIRAKFTNPAKMQPLFDAACAALLDFSTFLENDILPSAEGKFAAGHYRFERLLNEKHFLSTDADTVLQYGERLVEQTQQALLQQSEKLCGERDISMALDTIRAQHPAAEDILESYRHKMKTAYEWLQQADIVTLPARQSLKVQATPDFLRSVIPFAAYQPPSPQDREQQGLYYVTTVADEALLAEHNDYSIDLTSVHEAFPGHHLQFVTANQNVSANITRLLHDSASMYEGWALYCEQLVFECGLYDKPEHELILLRDRLWRALRIIIDVKLHTGQFSFDDAVDLLVDLLGFDVSQATAEVSWYCHEAATPLCYALGREFILQARARVVGEVESADNEALKVFHDSLLQQGSIALPLVIAEAFGESICSSVSDAVLKKRDH